MWVGVSSTPLPLPHGSPGVVVQGCDVDQLPVVEGADAVELGVPETLFREVIH